MSKNSLENSLDANTRVKMLSRVISGPGTIHASWYKEGKFIGNIDVNPMHVQSHSKVMKIDHLWGFRVKIYEKNRCKYKDSTSYFGTMSLFFDSEKDAHDARNLIKKIKQKNLKKINW